MMPMTHKIKPENETATESENIETKEKEGNEVNNVIQRST